MTNATRSIVAVQIVMLSDLCFQGHGTIKPYAAFNAEQDAQMLRKAMKGFGWYSFTH